MRDPKNDAVAPKDINTIENPKVNNIIGKILTLFFSYNFMKNFFCKKIKKFSRIFRKILKILKIKKPPRNLWLKLWSRLPKLLKSRGRDPDPRDPTINLAAVGI